MLDWQAILNYAEQGNLAPPQRIEKTPEQWQKLLSAEVFAIARQAGTERPFSQAMCSAFEAGQYACACCETVLFDSQEKYDSGSGWPSFTQPITENVVAYHVDNSHAMQRVEVTCNCCDAHLGHVFSDGPKPTGLRFCINALALEKYQQGEENANH